MDIQKDLEECTVVISINESVVGTGFLIGKGIVLTCYHVIEDVFLEAKILLNVFGSTFVATEYCKIENYDLVVIKSNIPNNKYLPIGLCCTPNPDDMLYTHGITKNHPDGESRTFRYEGRSDQGLLKCKDGEVEGGMSGSAVISSKDKTVIGVMKRTKAEGTNLGGYIVPLDYKALSMFPNEVLYDQNNIINTTLGREWFTSAQIDSFLEFWNRLKNPSVIREEITQSFKFYYNKLFKQRVSGSNNIKIDNLFSDNLLLKFSGSTDVEKNISNLENYVLKLLTSSDTSGVVITSPPGYGKTTFCCALLKHLLDDSSTTNTIIPVFIDMSSYTQMDIDSFGDDTWFKYRLKEYFNLTSIHYDYLMLHKEELVFIFESIDEFLLNFPANTINQLFSLNFFKKIQGISKLVFSCRKQNYDNYISSASLFYQMNIVQLGYLTDTKIRKYLKQYFKWSKTSRKTKNRIINLISNSDSIHTLSKNPLHLNMIIKLIERDQISESNQLTFRQFYEKFINTWLENENIKHPQILTYDEKMQILEKIAWHFFEENHVDANERGFSKNEIKALIQSEEKCENIDSVVNSLLQNALLIQKVIYHRTMINFSHKSFQEYFVASYIFRAVIENNNLTQILQNYLSSYVSEFYKEFLQECTPNEKITLVKHLKNAYDNSLCDKDDEEYWKKRIAREQIAYSLGVLKCKEADDYLSSILTTEVDVWVSRGIMLGLTFGDNPVYKNYYVEILKKERIEEKKNNICAIANECNIGYMLTFFGDQRFDIRHPDKDQGEANCENLIIQMLSLFQNETDFPAWRLHLYTLVDMFINREVSRSNMINSIKLNYKQYEKVVTQMEADVRCKDWPELKDFKEILIKIK